MEILSFNHVNHLLSEPIFKDLLTLYFILFCILATLIIDVVAIIMTMIMIYHIRSKYTAVGRQEIVMFFYMYMLSTLLDMLLVTGIIPTSSVVYPVSTCIHLKSHSSNTRLSGSRRSILV